MAGNSNSGRRSEKPFADALRMEIASRGENGKGLRLIAAKLIFLAEQGEAWAIKELADRTDGKAVQQQILSGDADAPLIPIINVNLRNE